MERREKKRQRKVVNKWKSNELKKILYKQTNKRKTASKNQNK